jgi:large subunit ribosomal protein L4
MPTAKTKVKSLKSVNKPEVKSKKIAVNTPIKEKSGSLKLNVYSLAGKVSGSVNLPKEIFGVEVNNNLIAQAVRVYLANQRRGTLKTKSRGEVNISTRKIYRQKGTGRARHGAASAPIFVGGGIAFGPKPRDFSLKLSRKMKQKALFSALSAKVKDNEIKIISGLEKIEPKTKKMAQVLKNLELKGKILLVTPKLDKVNDKKNAEDLKNVYLSARNLKGVSIRGINLLNTYEVLASENILFMKSAIEALDKKA